MAIGVAPASARTSGPGWGQLFGVTTGALLTENATLARPGTTTHTLELPAGTVSVVLRLLARTGVGINSAGVQASTVQVVLAVDGRAVADAAGSAPASIECGAVIAHPGGQLRLSVQATAVGAYTLGYSHLGLDDDPAHYTRRTDPTWHTLDMFDRRFPIRYADLSITGSTGVPARGVGTVTFYRANYINGYDLDPNVPYRVDEFLLYQTALALHMPSYADDPFTAPPLSQDSWAPLLGGRAAVPFRVHRTGPNPLRNLTLDLEVTNAINDMFYLEIYELTDENVRDPRTGQIYGRRNRRVAYEAVPAPLTVSVLDPRARVPSPTYGGEGGDYVFADILADTAPARGQWGYSQITYVDDYGNRLTEDLIRVSYQPNRPMPVGAVLGRVGSPPVIEGAQNTATISVADPNPLVNTDPRINGAGTTPLGMVVLVLDAGYPPANGRVPRYPEPVVFRANKVFMSAGSVSYRVPDRDYLTGFALALPPRHLLAQAQAQGSYRRRGRAWPAV